jgi:hypothetical protein
MKTLNCDQKVQSVFSPSGTFELYLSYLFHIADLQTDMFQELRCAVFSCYNSRFYWGLSTLPRSMLKLFKTDGYLTKVIENTLALIWLALNSEILSQPITLH